MSSERYTQPKLDLFPEPLARESALSGEYEPTHTLAIGAMVYQSPEQSAQGIRTKGMVRIKFESLADDGYVRCILVEDYTGWSDGNKILYRGTALYTLKGNLTSLNATKS